MSLRGIASILKDYSVATCDSDRFYAILYDGTPPPGTKKHSQLMELLLAYGFSDHDVKKLVTEAGPPPPLIEVFKYRALT